MTARVIKGFKQQIAEQVSNLPGEVREAIVFIDDASPAGRCGGKRRGILCGDAAAHVARRRGVLLDDSRQAVYEWQEGE